jgi:hypothetical protein
MIQAVEGCKDYTGFSTELQEETRAKDQVKRRFMQTAIKLCHPRTPEEESDIRRSTMRNLVKIPRRKRNGGY